VLERCNFIENGLPYSTATSARRYGGALYAAQSDLLITNSLFTSNTISSYQQNRNHGGAIYVTNGTLTIVDTLFVANRISSTGGSGTYNDYNYGGAIHADAPLVLHNCRLVQNRVETSAGGPCRGGAVYAAQPVVIAHTTFSANRAVTVLAAAQGGAFFAASNATLHNLLMNLNAVSGAPGQGAALFVDNGALALNAATIANNFGEGLYRAASSSLALRNSIFWNNTDDLAGLPTNTFGRLPDVSYCLIQDGDNEGFQGCLSADPQFERGFYLADGSPALDAGGDMAADLLLSDRTTRTNGAPDEGQLDLGFHFAGGLDPAVADLYVSGTGSDNQSGADWDNAFRSITRALSVARDGTCIHIGAGLYTTNGKTFPLTPTQQGLTVKGTGPEEVIINATGANTRVFVIQSLDQLCIQGVTIQGGVNARSNPFLGGGLYAAYSKLDLRDCRIANNTVTNLGEGFTFKGAVSMPWPVTFR